MLEQFYDAVPRSGARSEDFGPLTLFVREGPGWPFYARPTLGHPEVATAADVDRVRARQRELSIPEAFEWVHETTPGLRKAVEESGLTVHAHPLMVLADDAPAPVAARVAESSVSVRVLGAEDPFLQAALTVPHLAFAVPGTAVGPAGPAELAAEALARAGDGSVEQLAGRIGDGLTVVAAAVEDGVVLCAGQHNPVGGVTEIVGVGTLPSARRRGLALAVTAALVADARARGIGTVFLSAGDEDVARIYARLGFRPVATALIAEPAE
ncbi:GNAT family N-acetyltransferase [Streptomyces sp. A3M-1-3]|uniref:GNAT family N-acetyltransferase n=1 Tax=Streptomyces sp. A3M-1-3 TaxID=2962044 RepID=UPI0020B7298F|nr:GNAT family N-acetyltransferase [Streptomyces sp. A3M-1-3]MCP3817640.1 GNAT family N-acetyltransferase [Streptomyces sp. A3M-1-3]